jgi:hypothetical protein
MKKSSADYIKLHGDKVEKFKAFDFPPFPFDYEKYTENIINICGDNYKDIKLPGCRGVSNFDLYLAHQFAKRYNTTDIMELGVGTSTLFLKSLGYNVESFAREMPGNVPREKELRGKFNQCDVLASDSFSKIFEAAEKAQMLFIDCGHIFAIAKFYCQKLLLPLKKPAFVHDFFHPRRGMAYGEQVYLINEFLNDQYELFAMTDLPRGCIKKISNHLDFDITNQMLDDKWKRGSLFSLKTAKLYSALIVPKENV